MVENFTRPVEYYYDRFEKTNYNLVHSITQHAFKTFTSFTSRIPHNYYAYHRALAHLLVATRNRNTTNTMRQLRFEGQFWKDLPTYEPAFYGGWEDPQFIVSISYSRAVDIEHDTLGQLGGPSQLRDLYTNTNAFLARLVAVDDDDDGWWLNALCSFSWALECELNPDGLSLNIPGAAVWILYAGELVWECEKELAHPVLIRQVLNMHHNSEWNASKKNGFCEERWNLWKDKFQLVAHMEDVSEEARVLAGNAGYRMRWIERQVRRD